MSRMRGQRSWSVRVNLRDTEGHPAGRRDAGKMKGLLHGAIRDGPFFAGQRARMCGKGGRMNEIQIVYGFFSEVYGFFWENMKIMFDIHCRHVIIKIQKMKLCFIIQNHGKNETEDQSIQSAVCEQIHRPVRAREQRRKGGEENGKESCYIWRDHASAGAGGILPLCAGDQLRCDVRRR